MLRQIVRAHKHGMMLMSITVLLIASCSALGSSQNPEAIATEQNLSLSAEGTALRDAINRQVVDTAATGSAAETYIMERESINAQLLATLRAVVPPTRQIIQDAGAGTPSLNQAPAPPGVAGTPDPNTGSVSTSIASTGSLQFTAIQTASGVNDTDGCALDARNSFSSADAEIYLTARALNITAGTVVGAVWSLEGSVVYDDFSFTVESNDSDFCVWFSIDPATVTFTPGGWTAQFILNGTAVEPAVPFTITG